MQPGPPTSRDHHPRRSTEHVPRNPYPFEHPDLIGYTSKRGQAWHYRAEDQGSEPNHYEHVVPVADVRRRLFCWSPVEADLQAVRIDEDGVATYTDPTRKAIVRPDTGAILGVFRTGYQVHDYDQWLIDNVEGILDADLRIGSAGLLRGGAVAWVQVEMADTLEAAGVEFRPFLTATTSLDGTIVLDGGTQAGIMKEIGHQRRKGKFSFPPVGVIFDSLIINEDPKSILDPNHTHFTSS